MTRSDVSSTSDGTSDVGRNDVGGERTADGMSTDGADVRTQDARAIDVRDERSGDGPLTDSSIDLAADDGSPDVIRSPDASTEDAVEHDAADASLPPGDARTDASDAAADIAPVEDVKTDAPDACTANACGGCGPLGGVPGASCGQCGIYVCSTDKASVSCSDPGYVKYKAIAMGGSATCAVTATGGLRCWGAGAGLQPPPTDFLTNVTAVAVGDARCAVLTSGDLRCWGANGNGQMGDGTQNDSWTAPTKAILNGIHLVSASRHTCSLSTAGGVRCWGYNSFNQVGDGPDTSPRLKPQMMDVLSNAKEILAAWSYTCVVMKTGGVHCWGTVSGELGDNPVDIASSATELFTGAEKIAGSQFHRCALMTNGDVRCWGSNGSGQLGDTTTNPHPDAPTTAALGGAQGVATGTAHTVALTTASGVRTWGSNASGQLGYGNTTENHDPLGQPEVLTGVQAIAAGGDSTCALLTTGRIQCWGDNAAGQLGDGTQDSRHAPVDVLPVCP